jgi:hypothetical protein
MEEPYVHKRSQFSRGNKRAFWGEKRHDSDLYREEKRTVQLVRQLLFY